MKLAVLDFYLFLGCNGDSETFTKSGTFTIYENTLFAVAGVKVFIHVFILPVFAVVPVNSTCKHVSMSLYRSESRTFCLKFTGSQI